MDVEAARRRARRLANRGAYAEALATLEAAADALRAGDPDGAAGLLVDAVAVALYVRGPEGAAAIAERAVAAASPGGARHQQAVIRLGDALSWIGRYADAREAWQAASVDGAETDAVMLAERSNALLRLGSPEAHGAAFRALVAARRARDRTGVLDALNLVTVAEVRAGRLKEALGTSVELESAAEPRSVDAADGAALQAWVLALLGDEARCRAAMERAGRTLEEHNLTAPGGLARGLLALSLGAAGEAVAAFESKLGEVGWGPVAAMTGLRPFGAELVEAYARAGRPEPGRRTLAATLPVALGSAVPHLVAPMRRAQGILEEDEDAFRRALDAHAGWDNRFERARTRLAFGELLRRRKRRAEARTELEAAVAGFEHVGAATWRDRAQAELRLTGERLPARRPLPADAPEALTRQEGEVLELVRAGLSNRAIAERLVLSTKTVEGHLTTIYGKLGVASRAQALVALSRSEAD